MRFRIEDQLYVELMMYVCTYVYFFTYIWTDDLKDPLGYRSKYLKLALSGLDKRQTDRRGVKWESPMSNSGLID